MVCLGFAFLLKYVLFLDPETCVKYDTQDTKNYYSRYTFEIFLNVSNQPIGLYKEPKLLKRDLHMWHGAFTPENV